MSRVRPTTLGSRKKSRGRKTSWLIKKNGRLVGTGETWRLAPAFGMHHRYMLTGSLMSHPPEEEEIGK